MGKPEILQPEVLRQLLRYEPDTGRLFWRARPDHLFLAKKHADRWNTRFADKQAFTSDNGKGYKRGKIFDVPYRANRVIWAMVTGNWPDGYIDHRNGDRSDDRLANLRQATPSENQMNRAMQSTNTSGMKGVCWHRPLGKWRASIKKEGKTKHIGYFETKEAAYAAYVEACGVLHGSFARVA